MSFLIIIHLWISIFLYDNDNVQGNRGSAKIHGFIILYVSCFQLSFIECYNLSHSIGLHLNFISLLLNALPYRRPFSIHISLCWLRYTLYHKAYSTIILDLFHMLSLGFYSLITPHWSPSNCKSTTLTVYFRFQNLHFPAYNHKSKQPYWPTFVSFWMFLSKLPRDLTSCVHGSWLDKCSHFCALIEMMNMDALSREL